MKVEMCGEVIGAEMRNRAIKIRSSCTLNTQEERENSKRKMVREKKNSKRKIGWNRSLEIIHVFE